MAVNKIKGEVALDLGEQGKFTLVYDFAALEALEEKFGLSIIEISGLLETKPMPRMKHMRTFIWAGLQANHPDIGEKAAGDLLMALGAASASDKINEAFAAAFPVKTQGEGGGDPR